MGIDINKAVPDPAFAARFLAARRDVIARDLRKLNPMQRQAAMTTEGPLLILAGAGSGKTTTLIQRVYNLLTYGRASDPDNHFIPDTVTEDDLVFLESFPDHPTEEEFSRMRDLCAVEPPKPWQILAITFTNKAAGELKDRLAARLGPSVAGDVWASTFHSACVRILRRYIDSIGFERDFTIYDTDDSQRVMREIIKEHNLDKRIFSEKAILREIGKAKDQYISPEEYPKWAAGNHPHDPGNAIYAKLYARYEEYLHAANALDFDDIIFHTVTLLKENPEAKEYYQNQFHYVLVDEYQDTNYLQYQLTSLLTERRRNLCVVGDDDQSIYAFRGADIRNIREFEQDFPDARVVLLEQNYRSTPNILNAANAVISRNSNRNHHKKLWTKNPLGETVRVNTLRNESEEADFIAHEIERAVRNGGGHYRDYAILYRINALSNALEAALRNRRIPYKIIGGLKFFDRAEIKDLLAYLQVAHNTMDDFRLRRIINRPARGIGALTVQRLSDLAQREGASLYEIIQCADQFPELKTASKKLLAFGKTLYGFYQRREGSVLDLFDAVRVETGYDDALRRKNDDDSAARLENIQELRSDISRFVEQNPEDHSLFAYLNKISLYTSLDDLSQSDDYVTMMTVHSAKGLEFPTVYVAGMEKGLFPSYNADSEEAMEEERRLCYVAMTRAKDQLILCNAKRRMRGGMPSDTEPSQFLDEIPEPYLNWKGKHLFSSPMDNYFARSYGGFSSGGDSARTARKIEPAPRTRENTRIYQPTSENSASDQPLSLSVGDAVTHTVFGPGTVVSVQPVASDVMARIDFENVGVKKLMLKYASALMRKI